MTDEFEAGLVARLRNPRRPAARILIDALTLARHRAHRSADERLIEEIATRVAGGARSRFAG